MSLPIYIQVETKNDMLKIKRMDKESHFFELNYIDDQTIELIKLEEITDQCFFDNNNNFLRI